MVRKRTTVMLDVEKARMIRALGYTVSGLLNRILDAVFEGKEEELIEELKLQLKRKTETSTAASPATLDMRFKPCDRCGSTEYTINGDIAVCTKCAKIFNVEEVQI